MAEKTKLGRPKIMDRTTVLQITLPPEQKTWLEQQPEAAAATIRKLIAQAMGIQSKKGKQHV